MHTPVSSAVRHQRGVPAAYNAQAPKAHSTPTRGAPKNRVLTMRLAHAVTCHTRRRTSGASARTRCAASSHHRSAARNSVSLKAYSPAYVSGIHTSVNSANACPTHGATNRRPKRYAPAVSNPRAPHSTTAAAGHVSRPTARVACSPNQNAGGH